MKKGKCLLVVVYKALLLAFSRKDKKMFQVIDIDCVLFVLHHVIT